MNLFPKFRRKPKTGYLLEVIEAPANTVVRKSRVKGGFSYGKKLLAGLALAAIAVTGLGTAAYATTAAPEKANAFDLFNVNSWFCDTLDTPGAYLGGTSETLSSAWYGEIKSSPINNGLNITITSSDSVNPYVNGKGEPKSGARWTALEQYGYYNPGFESWRGSLWEADKHGKDDGTWPFAGSGGYGALDKYGDLVGVKDGDKSRLYETNGLACLDLGGASQAGFGNFIFSLTKISVAVAAEVYGVAFNMDSTNESSPLYGMAQGIETMITGGDNPESGLKSVLYLDWLILLIVVATFSLIWIGLIKRSSLQAGQAAIWMIASSIAGMIFLTNPLMIPSVIDKVVGDVSASVTSAILPTENDGTNLCKVDGNDGDASIRQVKCAVWYSTIYSPWVKGQFGVNEYDLARYASSTKGSLTGDALEAVNSTSWMYEDGYKSSRASVEESNVVNWEGEPEGAGFEVVKDQASANVNSASRGIFSKANIKFGGAAYDGTVNWAIYQLDRQATWGAANAERGLDYSEIAFNQLVVNKNDQWKTASDAIGSAFMSLMGAAGPVIVLATLSLTMIGYQLSMLFLIAFSPMIFLVGVAPGWGRSIAMRWLELIVGLLVKRIVLVFFLVLFVKLYMLVIRSDIDWWVQAVLAGVLSIVALTQRDKITGIFNDVINFGGRKDIDGGGTIAQKGKEASSKTLKGAVAVGGFVAGKTVANRQAKKAALKKAELAAQAKDTVAEKRAGGPSKKTSPNGEPQTETPTGRGTGGERGSRRSGEPTTPDTPQPTGGRRANRETAALTSANRSKRAQRQLDRRNTAQSARTASFNNDLKNIQDKKKNIENEKKAMDTRFKQGEIKKRDYIKGRKKVNEARAELRDSEKDLKKRYSKDTSKHEKFIKKETTKETKFTEKHKAKNERHMNKEKQKNSDRDRKAFEAKQKSQQKRYQ